MTQRLVFPVRLNTELLTRRDHTVSEQPQASDLTAELLGAQAPRLILGARKGTLTDT